MEQEERLALEQELTQARADLEQLQGEMQEIKSRNADLDLKENERSTGNNRATLRHLTAWASPRHTI